MPARSEITVSAPGRLHFGLFAVGDLVPRTFGGMGVMVRDPRATIRASVASRCQTLGPQQAACRMSAQRWFDAFDIASQLGVVSIEELPVRLEAIELPPRHSGLGSGTQIALTTATALNHFFQLPTPSLSELSVAVGRAKRSAIGSHGFVEGGFLVDQGKTSDEPIASLDFQIDFPSDWPIVLMFPDQPIGLAGEQEQAAFDRIPPTTLSEYAAMRALVQTQVVPALVQLNYESFAAALFEFGRRSGLYFRTVQGGPYNGTHVRSLVDHCCQQGVNAVGQTSWGPCVFAIAKDLDKANALAQSVKQNFGDQCRVQITQADNQGVTINGQTNQLPGSSVINRLQY